MTHHLLLPISGPVRNGGGLLFPEVSLRFLSKRPITNGVGEAADHDDPTWPRYIRITDIQDETSLKEDTFRSLPPSVAAGAEVFENDLLLAAVGATFGKSYLHKNFEGEACFAGFLVRVSPNELMLPEFMLYWTQSSHYWSQVRSNAVQSTIQNFSAGKYRRLKAPCPELGAQKRIASFLDRETAKIDALIAKKQRLIAVLDEQRATTISDAMKPPKDAPNWDNKGSARLKHFLKLNYGDALAVESRREGEVLVYGSNGVVGCHDASNTLGPAIIVGRKGSHGKVNWADDPGFCIDTAYFVDSRHCQGDLRFAYYLLLSLDLDRESRDSAVPGLDRDEAHNRRIWIPEVASQRQIAELLDRETHRLDQIKIKTARSVENLREYRSALITAAVTGQIDVDVHTQNVVPSRDLHMLEEATA